MSKTKRKNIIINISIYLLTTVLTAFLIIFINKPKNNLINEPAIPDPTALDFLMDGITNLLASDSFGVNFDLTLKNNDTGDVSSKGDIYSFKNNGDYTVYSNLNFTSNNVSINPELWIKPSGLYLNINESKVCINKSFIDNIISEIENKYNNLSTINKIKALSSDDLLSMVKDITLTNKNNLHIVKLKVNPSLITEDIDTFEVSINIKDNNILSININNLKLSNNTISITANFENVDTSKNVVDVEDFLNIDNILALSKGIYNTALSKSFDFNSDITTSISKLEKIKCDGSLNFNNNINLLANVSINNSNLPTNIYFLDNNLYLNVDSLKITTPLSINPINNNDLLNKILNNCTGYSLNELIKSINIFTDANTTYYSVILNKVIFNLNEDLNLTIGVNSSQYASSVNIKNLSINNLNLNGDILLNNFGNASNLSSTVPLESYVKLEDIKEILNGFINLANKKAFDLDITFNNDISNLKFILSDDKKSLDKFTIDIKNSADNNKNIALTYLNDIVYTSTNNFKFKTTKSAVVNLINTFNKRSNENLSNILSSKTLIDDILTSINNISIITDGENKILTLNIKNLFSSNNEDIAVKIVVNNNCIKTISSSDFSIKFNNTATDFHILSPDNIESYYDFTSIDSLAMVISNLINSNESHFSGDVNICFGSGYKIELNNVDLKIIDNSIEANVELTSPKMLGGLISSTDSKANISFKDNIIHLQRYDFKKTNPTLDYELALEKDYTLDDIINSPFDFIADTINMTKLAKTGLETAMKNGTPVPLEVSKLLRQYSCSNEDTKTLYSSIFDLGMIANNSSFDYLKIDLESDNNNILDTININLNLFSKIDISINLNKL